MKNLIIALIVGTCFYACSRDEKRNLAEKTQNAQDLIEMHADSLSKSIIDETQDASQTILSEKEALISKANKSKEKLNEKLMKANEDLKNATLNEKARLVTKVKSLQESIDELDTVLDELKQEQAKDWKVFKQDLNSHIDKIQSRIQ